MSEQTGAEIEVTDLTDELSDEVLDRTSTRFCSYVSKKQDD